MKAERKSIIAGKLIEEFYWAGKMVVYIDNQKVGQTFEEACNQIRRGDDKEPPEEKTNE